MDEVFRFGEFGKIIKHTNIDYCMHTYGAENPNQIPTIKANLPI